MVETGRFIFSNLMRKHVQVTWNTPMFFNHKHIKLIHLHTTEIVANICTTTRQINRLLGLVQILIPDYPYAILFSTWKKQS